MTSERMRIGISTCPNDTFVFAGLLAGEVEAEGLALEFELDDVEALNRGLLAGRFDVAKASFAAHRSLSRNSLSMIKGGTMPEAQMAVKVSFRLNGLPAASAWWLARASILWSCALPTT